MEGLRLCDPQKADFAGIWLRTGFALAGTFHKCGQPL